MIFHISVSVLFLFRIGSVCVLVGMVKLELPGSHEGYGFGFEQACDKTGL